MEKIKTESFLITIFWHKSAQLSFQWLKHSGKKIYAEENAFNSSNICFHSTDNTTKVLYTFFFPSFSVRGMTEGITLLILAVQTGLIELQVIHRAFLLSIILFIVVASILQSMLEIADPIVLALGASRDK